MMAFGKVFVPLSLLVCAVAVLFTVDVFRPYRDAILDRMPDSVKESVEDYVERVQSFISSKSAPRMFTKEELAKYKGENGGPIYLAILGRVFDVSRGRKHYGPDGGYSGFAGRDGSRAFITGDFTEKGLIEDFKGLSSTELLGLYGWQKFYAKDYKYIGKLEGHYFDSEGSPTQNMEELKQALKAARKEEQQEKEEMKTFPPCNSESGVDRDRRVWCTNQSGGVRREWTGVPRQLFKPGRREPRCACVKESGASVKDPSVNTGRGDLDNPNLKPYPGCPPTSQTCVLPD